MVKRRIPLRAITAVAASKTVVIDLPTGPTYHQVILQTGYTGGTNTIVGAAANMADIRVKVNGRVQRSHTGAQLRDLNNLMGTYTSAMQYDCTGLPNTAPGVSFPIFFAEPWRKQAAAQEALAWRTNRWNSLQIEVDLGAGTAPYLVAYAIVDDSYEKPNDPPGLISKVIRQNFSAAGTSYDITTLDKRDFLTGLLIYPDSGASNAPSKVTLRKDGMILHEMSATANLALLQTNGMQPVLSTVRTASVYDVVIDHDDLLASAINLDGSKDLVVSIEAGAAMSGTQTVLVQRVGLPE